MLSEFADITRTGAPIHFNQKRLHKQLNVIKEAMTKKSASRPSLHSMTKTFVASLRLSVFISSSVAFQPIPFVTHLKHSAPGRFFNDRTMTSMRYQSPWDLAANSASRKQQTSVDWSPKSWRGSRFETLPFSHPGIFDNCLRIGDPEVLETQADYTLTFNLPAEVKEDGLDVSISGRILTLEARVTREINTEGGRESRGTRRWVVQSHNTHSCARSFVLPNSVPSNHVQARWVGDSTFKIVLEKGHPHTGDSHVHMETVADMADAAAVPVECRDDKTIPSSVADDYLSNLKAANHRGRFLLDPWAELTGSSLLPTLDDDFRNFGKSIFNHDGLRFPTEDQVAATVAKARKKRARRVTAIKRAMMATDVSETKISYVVRFSLPEGATRSNVKLTVTPDKAIRASFSPDGHPSVSKYVRLPWDAEMSKISARFQEDESIGSVSSLTVNVGRKGPLPQPKIIDIE